MSKPVDYKSNVGHCARCGQDHDEVEWFKFDRAIDDHEDGGGEWTHWGICPNSGDPILMRFEKVSKQ